MKARYKYRIYPTDQQRGLLAQLFGCVRVVWNDALIFCQSEYLESNRKPSYNELSKRLTNFKKTEDREWLTEVSSIPLQQSLRDLEIAYSNFFNSCTGKRKSVTIIKDSADRYFASFVVDLNPHQLPITDNSVGIDLGINDFATLSNGEKVKSPEPLKKRLKRLRRLQKNLSRKQKGSKRREVARKKVGAG